MSMYMGSLKRSLLVYFTYLFFVVSLLTLQQNDICDPTNPTNNIGGVCGPNGACQGSGDSAYCICLPGFHSVDSSDSSKGCLQNTSQMKSCGASGATMERVESINWYLSDYRSLDSTNEAACQQSCIEDCHCTVAIYDIPNATCWMKQMPLVDGIPNSDTIAFVKVYTEVDESVPPTSSAPLPMQRKEETGRGLVFIGMIIMACLIPIKVILLIVKLAVFTSNIKSSTKNSS
ncbi:hypothetical protein SUGI_0715700 [Cryptomeria japonica]|nr:hypothetical protein SUGI_0715700 [Cryptomeria japonica]